MSRPVVIYTLLFVVFPCAMGVAGSSFKWAAGALAFVSFAVALALAIEQVTPKRKG